MSSLAPALVLAMVTAQPCPSIVSEVPGHTVAYVCEIPEPRPPLIYFYGRAAALQREAERAFGRSRDLLAKLDRPGVVVEQPKKAVKKKTAKKPAKKKSKKKRRRG